MARLTFESVHKYAENCGYELSKLSYSYTLNGSVNRGIDGYSLTTLAYVIETIKNGYLLNGQSSPLPEIEQPEGVEDNRCPCYANPESDRINCAQCNNQATVTCVYSNCETPCYRNCEPASITKEDLLEKPHEIKWCCDINPTYREYYDRNHPNFEETCPLLIALQENTSIYIDVKPAYQVITSPPIMHQYEVPLLEKCLQIETLESIKAKVLEKIKPYQGIFQYTDY